MQTRYCEKHPPCDGPVTTMFPYYWEAERLNGFADRVASERAREDAEQASGRDPIVDAMPPHQRVHFSHYRPG